jgi:hypothetical protein
MGGAKTGQQGKKLNYQDFIGCDLKSNFIFGGGM